MSRSDKKIDKPDEVAFAKAISDNLPGKEAADKLWYTVAGTYIANKVIRNAKNR